MPQSACGWQNYCKFVTVLRLRLELRKTKHSNFSLRVIMKCSLLFCSFQSYALGRVYHYPLGSCPFTLPNISIFACCRSLFRSRKPKQHWRAVQTQIMSLGRAKTNYYTILLQLANIRRNYHVCNTNDLLRFSTTDEVQKTQHRPATVLVDLVGYSAARITTIGSCCAPATDPSPAISP